MNIVIVSIHITAAVILVLTVLLQAGKGAGMGAAFGGSSGTVFGTRGPATLISKITCAAAVIFMCTSLNMAISQGGLSRGSVMDEWSSEVGATPAPMASPVSSSTEGAASGSEFAATPAPATAVDESAASADEAAATDGQSAVTADESSSVESQAMTEIEPGGDVVDHSSPIEDPVPAVITDSEPAE